MLDQPPLNRVVQREGEVKQEAIETFRQDDLDLQYQASYASSTGYEDEDGRLSPNAPAGRRAAQRQQQQIADHPHGQVCNVEDDMEGYETLDEDDASKANHTVLVRLESYDELPSEISQHAQAKKFWRAEGSKGQRGIQQEGVSDQFANELPKMSTLPEETEGREFFYAPTAHSMPAREVLHRAGYEKDVIAQRAKVSQVPILPMAAKNKSEDVYMATTAVNQSPTSNAVFAQNRSDMDHLQEPVRQTRKQMRSYHGDMMSGFAARQAADLKDPMSSFSSGGGGGGLGGRNASRRAKSCNPGDALPRA
ncbi:unnamed protein product [Dibothriocephalus latus]|uniref:Uncharacterized protein n=1 Tax=Dibothriocephalus latus TaxID=60516 RepID=A0A3P6R911_DIBLA|nr:unnamed protein product [Dibothriocephalus latus]